MGLLFQIERKLNEKKAAKRREREIAIKRQLETFPNPTYTWKKDGCLIEVYVVKQFSIFGRITTLYRLGVATMVRGEPTFSSYFQPRASVVLLELLNEAKSWHDIFATLNSRDMIPELWWRHACAARRPDSAIRPTLSLGRDDVECDYSQIESYSTRTVHRIRSKKANEVQPSEFFSLLDFPAVESLLKNVSNQHIHRAFEISPIVDVDADPVPQNEPKVRPPQQPLRDEDEPPLDSINDILKH